jgi:hypothetical protein
MTEWEINQPLVSHKIIQKRFGSIKNFRTFALSEEKAFFHKILKMQGENEVLPTSLQ